MCDDPVIDVREFAESGGRIAGTVAASSLARLADLLAEERGDVAYSVAAALDGDGNPRLQIDVSGLLTLRCQRCLGALLQVVAARRELRFVASAALLPEVADEPPDVDDLPTPTAMRVLDWVEDEILLALPISPRHEEGACRPPPNPAAEADTVARPFSRLAKLGLPRPQDQ